MQTLSGDSIKYRSAFIALVPIEKGIERAFGFYDAFKKGI